jgi:hypothetical protein
MRIIRGLGSRTLPCGCLVGIYETYNRRTIGVIDATTPACRESHRVNTVLEPAAFEKLLEHHAGHPVSTPRVS